MPDPTTIYRACPACGGTGQIPETRFAADARIGCTRPCTTCRQVRVVEVGSVTVDELETLEEMRNT